MDPTVDELALAIFRQNQTASVAEITHWLRTEHMITDPDQVREVIIHFWNVQQDGNGLHSPE